MHAAMPAALLFLLLWCSRVNGYPASIMDQETESDDTRHILGSSVVTSVSVVMDLGNGSQKIYADSTGRPVPKPVDAANLASPPSMMHPDRYEFYTFNDEGDLVKRLMTLEEIQSLIAGESVEIGSDLPGYDHEDNTQEEKLPAFFFLPRPIEQSQDWSPPAVDNVVAKVQNILTQMRNSTIDASMNEPSWAILPSSGKPVSTTDVPKITEMIPVSTQTIKDMIKITTEKIPAPTQQTTEEIKTSTEKISTTTQKISTQQKLPPPFPVSNYVEYEVQKLTKKPTVTSTMPPTDAIPIKPISTSSIQPLINELNENEIFEYSTYFPLIPVKTQTQGTLDSDRIEETTFKTTTVKITEVPTTVRTTIKTQQPTTVKVTQPPSTTVKRPATFAPTTARPRPPSTTAKTTSFPTRAPTFSTIKISASGITTEIPPPVKFTKTTTSNGLTTLVLSSDQPTKKPTTFAQRTTVKPTTYAQRTTTIPTTVTQKTTQTQKFTTQPTTTVKRTTLAPTTTTQKSTTTVRTTIKTTQSPITTQKITKAPVTTTTTELPRTTEKITISTDAIISTRAPSTTNQPVTKRPTTVPTTLLNKVPASTMSVKPVSTTLRPMPVSDKNITSFTVKKPVSNNVESDFVPESIPEDEEVTTKKPPVKVTITTPVKTTEIVTKQPVTTRKPSTTQSIKPTTGKPQSASLNKTTTSKPQVEELKKPSQVKPQYDSNKPTIPLNLGPIMNDIANTLKANTTRPMPLVTTVFTTQKPPGTGFYVLATSSSKKPIETTTQKIMTSQPEKLSTFIPQVTPTVNKPKQNATNVKKPAISTSTTTSNTQKTPVSTSTTSTQEPVTKVTTKAPPQSSTTTTTPTVKVTTKLPSTTVKNTPSPTEKPALKITKAPQLTVSAEALATEKPSVKVTTKLPSTSITNTASVTEKIPDRVTINMQVPTKVQVPSHTTFSTPTTRTTHKPMKVSTLKPITSTIAPQIIFQSDNLLDRNTVLLAESLVNSPQNISSNVDITPKKNQNSTSDETMTSKTSDFDLTSEYSTLLELVTENSKPTSTQYIPVNLESPSQNKKPSKPSKPSDLLDLLSEITSDFGAGDDESQETTDSPSATTYFEIPFISALSGDSEETTNPSSNSNEFTLNTEMFKIPWDSSEESTEVINNPSKKPSSTLKPHIYTAKPQILKPYKPEFAKPEGPNDNDFIMHINANTGMFETIPIEKIPITENILPVKPFLAPEETFFSKVPLTDAKKPLSVDEIQTDIDAHQAAFLTLHKEVMNKLTTLYSKPTVSPQTLNKFSTEKIPESSSVKFQASSVIPKPYKPVSPEEDSNEAFEKLTTLEPSNDKEILVSSSSVKPITENPPKRPVDSEESTEENSEETSSEEKFTNSMEFEGTTLQSQNEDTITEKFPDLEVSWQEPQEVVWTAKPGDKPWSPLSEIIPPAEVSTLKPVKTSVKPSSTTMNIKIKPSTSFVLTTSNDKTTESPIDNEVKLVTISDFTKVENVPTDFTVSSEGSTSSWITKFPSSTEATTQKIIATTLITKRPSSIMPTTLKITTSPMLTKLTTIGTSSTQKLTTPTRAPSTNKPTTLSVKTTPVTTKMPTTQNVKSTVTKSPISLSTSASVSTSSEEMELISSSKPVEQKSTTPTLKIDDNKATTPYERATSHTKADTDTTEKARHPNKPDLLAEDMELISSSNAEEGELTAVTASIKPSLQQNYYGPELPLEHAPPNNLGLEATTVALDEDIRRFIDLNNDVAIRMFKHVTSEHDKRRSIALSPFGATSLLAMVFLGARGQTSAQMNDFLPFDDMITFNPHLVMRNITDTVIMSPDLQAAAIVRQLYSQKDNARLLDFYKARVGAFYDGLVQEVDFEDVSEVVRQHTNQLVRAQTSEHVPDFLSKTATLRLRPPLAALSANVFQMECKNVATQSRLPDLQFNTDRPGVQHVLFSSIWTGQFLVGYDAGLDATAVEIPHSASPGGALTSTIFVMPGRPNSRGGTPLLARLEARLISRRAWSGLLRNLMRSKMVMDVQVPRFEHRSVLNLTVPLRRMGLKDLFNPGTADLKGINGISDLYLTDLMQVNAFSACSDASAEGHVETYPTSRRTGRVGGRQDEDEEEWRSSQYNHLPLALRPRQARIPQSSDIPRLRLDRPFLYVVRHNPTGMILHIGRFNPRLNS